MNSNILFGLMIFTFVAVLVFAFLDLQNTRRAIRQGETSSLAKPALGAQTDGFDLAS